MKILITGAGLVGCHAARELTSQGHRVWLFDASPNQAYVEAIAGKKGVRMIRGDLRDLPTVIRALRDVRPAVTVHTAGFIGGEVANPPYRGVQTNIVGSANVFEACQIAGVKRVVHVSTFGVYDWENIRRGPVKEDFPLGGHTFYHATKIANELLLDAYRRFYDFEGVVIRPASVYGPGHYRGGSTGGMNINELVRACLGNGAIAIDEKRIGKNDFAYAKDVGRGIALACTAPKAAGKTFNIGAGEVYGPEDFRRVIARLCPDREIRLVRAEAGDREGFERVRLDLSQAKRILGYTPQYPLAKGLKDYIERSRELGFWS
ncbi:MAG: NAD(P)-dependent oxidoreductase [Deltaproteobacteria bacterium]|nr:NAD(P)-dependent oxidoreductase [Deltaproteobacteria bacterium]